MNDDYNRLNSGEELTETGNILYLGEELSETRNILNLSTFYDAEHSVLRVGGRLSQRSLSENKKRQKASSSSGKKLPHWLI